MKKLVYKIKNMVKNIFNKKTSKSQDDIPTHLEYPKISIYELIERTATKYPDNLAYEYFGNVATYKEFIKKIKTVSSALKKIGVAKNDRVTICMPNTPEAIIMFYATNMVGAIASMVHPLSAENEIEIYLNESESTLLFVLDMVYDKVHNIIDNTKIKKIIIGSVGDNLKPIKKILYKYKSHGKIPKIELTDDIMTWKEFLNYGYDYDGEYASLKGPNDPAAILYSGGTSGDPKGILVSNLNLNSLALQCHKMINFANEGTSILSILPIFHGFGLGVCIHTPLCCGMKIILIPDFSPKNFLSDIKKYQPNLICGVPSLFESLAKNTKIGKHDLASIKCLVSGGDFMSGDLKRAIDDCLHEHGSDAEVLVGYGLTESTAATCVSLNGMYKDNSIGVPFPDTYYKIVAIGTNEEVPYGTDGEICISGPTVMMGYINNVNENLKTLREHDDKRVWLHTGDIGYMDADGFVFFRQRIKRMIVSNGYNLYPTYIENVLNTYPDVLTSVVIGIPHPKRVQVAKAYIVLKDEIKPTKEIEKKIKNHCEVNLAKYSLPYEYEFRESLPKTLVGKVAYKKLEKENIKE